MQSERIATIAAVVNSLSVVILVAVTAYYAKKTADILEESRKARIASESQALAAQHSLDLLRAQLVDQLGIGRAVIESAIESAMSAISYWKQRPLTNVSKGPGLPPSGNLVPANALAAVEHARRFSPQAAQELSSAFDDLRSAVSEIERVKLLTNG